MAKKVEKTLEMLNKDINKAAKEKDMQTLEEKFSYKLCYDAHLFGKNILANFRSLFTFTNALIMSMTSNKPLNAKYFEDYDTFQKEVITLPVEKGD